MSFYLATLHPAPLSCPGNVGACRTSTGMGYRTPVWWVASSPLITESSQSAGVVKTISSSYAIPQSKRHTTHLRP